MKQPNLPSSILAMVFAMTLAHNVVAGEIRIGVVNTRTIIETAPQSIQALESIKKEFAPKEAKVVDMQKALKLQEEKRAKEGITMSESARRNLEREIVSSQRELKTTITEFQEDLNLRRNDELKKIKDLALQAVNAMARADGYDLILSDDNVLYSSDKVDITKKVLERMQK